jgi:hypothetical protein
MDKNGWLHIAAKMNFGCFLLDTLPHTQNDNVTASATCQQCPGTVDLQYGIRQVYSTTVIFCVCYRCITFES